MSSILGASSKNERGWCQPADASSCGGVAPNVGCAIHGSGTADCDEQRFESELANSSEHMSLRSRDLN